jgi:Ser/Thr protein kinase RdoA (MazF antagonist)
MIDTILNEFGFKKENAEILPLRQGLINNTWKISINGDAYIFQKINSVVFKHPEDIAFNLNLISEYLQKNEPAYHFVFPVKSAEGKSLVYKKGEGFYRAFPFVAGSHSKVVAETPEQAFEAAKQFGRFTKLLKGIDVKLLKITIPNFHDLSLRYQMFLEALEKGNKVRIEESADLINQIKSLAYIVDKYEGIKNNPEFILRVTHHDTKISNVLFDENDKGICVIDLDTVMPGYFISDVGDMMRTYLSPVGEEETDFSKIQIRPQFYHAIAKGYLSEMNDELTETEKKHFFYSGLFMIFMQAIRFLTDYFNNDAYYGSKYPEHNLNRAKNQTKLLQCLLEKESEFANSIIEMEYNAEKHF